MWALSVFSRDKGKALTFSSASTAQELTLISRDVGSNLELRLIPSGTGHVVYTFDPSIQEVEADRSFCEFEPSLVYLGNSRSSRVTQCEILT